MKFKEDVLFATEATPHSGQNFLPEVLSFPHLEQRILIAQLIEQRLGVLQVGGVEALGEAVVDVGEQRTCLVKTILLREQARETQIQNATRARSDSPTRTSRVAVTHLPRFVTCTRF